MGTAMRKGQNGNDEHGEPERHHMIHFDEELHIFSDEEDQQRFRDALTPELGETQFSNDFVGEGASQSIEESVGGWQTQPVADDFELESAEVQFSGETGSSNMLNMSASKPAAETETSHTAENGNAEAVPASPMSLHSGSGESSADDEEEEYAVEQILKYRLHSKLGPQYYVKWEGFDESENTWEPVQNLAHSKVLLRTFWATTRQRRPPETRKHTEDAEEDEEEEVTEVGSTTSESRKRRQDRPTVEEPPRKKLSVAAARRLDAVSSHTVEDMPADFSALPNTWEHLVDRIENAQLSPFSSSELVMTLLWKDGRREQHKASEVYNRCPLKAISYFATHVDPIEL